MAKVADKYFKVDPWAIIEEGFDPAHSEVAESIFSLSNEYMGVRGYLEEGYSGNKLIGSYFNGIYEETGTGNPSCYKGIAMISRFMVNTVDWLYTRIKVDGEELDLAKSNISGFIRRIDLKTGVLSREFVWNTVSGKSLKLTFLRFLSMIDSNLACQRILIEPINFSGKVGVTAGLDFTPVHQTMDGINYWNCPKKGKEGPIVALLGKTLNTQQYILSSFRLDCDQPINENVIEDEKFIGVNFNLNVQQGKCTSFDKMIVNYVDKTQDISVDEVWKKGIRLAQDNQKITFDAAMKEHDDYWLEVWDTLDITIEGDPENQQGIRYGIFQLHQTYHGQDPRNNIGAKGLTGEAYSGHTFWDTETYCLPFYIFSNPKAARNLLGYRYNTLPQALEWAKEQDCEGAQYPMSTIDGTESCGVWWHGNLEIHVSAAVSYGIWNYVRQTGDKEFLYEQGMEMLLQISRFFLSRGNWNDDGEFGFYGVMGADEFHTMVSNNCYTNVMAKKAFEYTLEVLEDMKANASQQLEQICRKVELRTDEPEKWKKAAEKMIILQDKETGIYEQHDGFFNLPPMDIHAIPMEEFPLIKNWTLPRLYRYNMIKQADFLLLPFFYSQDYSLDIKRVNYEYYEPKCIHESSLSPSVHSILASEIGKLEEAREFALYSTRLDLDDYNRNACQGLHTTAIAAAWMNIVYGFGGMRTDGETLIFKPNIPKTWTSFSFRILYKDSVIKISVNKEAASFVVLRGALVSIKVYEKNYILNDQEIQIELPEEYR